MDPKKAGIAFAQAMKHKWVKGDKTNVERLVGEVEDVDG